MKMRTFALLLLATVASSLAAMPTKQELKQVEGLVQELMRPEVDAMKAGKKNRADVAKAAVALAEKAESDAAKLLLLKGSFTLYVGHGAFDEAIDVLRTIRTTIPDVSPQHVANMVESALRNIPKNRGGQLYRILDDAKARVRHQDALKAALEKSAKRPSLRALHVEIAEHYAFFGDWSKALDEFAKGDNAKAAEVAKAEKGEGKMSQKAIAEFWWNYAAAEEVQRAFRRHAAEVYAAAIASGGISGLETVLAKRRIDEVKECGEDLLAPVEKKTAPPGGNAPAAVSGEHSNALYCVIDLSAGPNADKYPVSYLDAEPKGGWTDEYKTTKLVLRRIEPGTFKLGGKRKYEVMFTKPYYMGVFEVTQKQYELVTGKNPAKHKGDGRPVTNVSWNEIRGDSSVHDWPTVRTVDANSIVGRIRARTGLSFDLPTDAQWECACRAGTTSNFNNGGDSDDDRRKLGRFFDNRLDGRGGYAEHTTVGSYLPNAWGLYDMHGNVREWCLDWATYIRKDTVDPVGPVAARDETSIFKTYGKIAGMRILRDAAWRDRRQAQLQMGGHWIGVASPETSNDPNDPPDKSNDLVGFRLCMNPEGPVGASAQGNAAPAASAVSNEKLPMATSEQPKPLVLDLGGGVKMEMMGCPAGKFVMTGYMSQEYKDLPNGGKHSVEITRPFWIGKYPVTIEQWQRLMSKVEPLPGVKPKHMDPKTPVQVLLNNTSMGGLSRKTAEAFMAELTRKFKRQLPPGYIFRLPTEAEWEYAFKANSSDPDDPFANQNPPKERIFESFVLYEDSERYWQERGCDSVLFAQKNGLAPYIPVGQRKPNAWGIFDMGGCTLECFLDSYVKGPRPWQESHRDVFVDNVKDPLVFDDDPSQKRTVLSRYGFRSKEHLRWEKGPSSAHGRWGVDYNLKWGGGALKIRLVAGPDLLKERGITPPKLDK